MRNSFLEVTPAYLHILQFQQREEDRNSVFQRSFCYQMSIIVLFWHLYLSFIKFIQLNARLAKLYMFVAFSFWRVHMKIKSVSTFT